MRPLLIQRQLVLAALALLAAVVALAVTDRQRTHTQQAALPPAQGSYTALVGSSTAASLAGTTACGVAVGAHTLGISSPVLPCGIRLYLAYRDEHVLAPVIARGAGPGREFDLTRALARRLGVHGVRRVHWSYAEAT